MGYDLSMRVEQTNEYLDLIDGLKDLSGRARTLVRVDRLIHGNPRAYRNLTHGVSELKVDAGPGDRVYYSRRGDRLLLLAGGDESTQAKDIAQAIRLAQAYGD